MDKLLLAALFAVPLTIHAAAIPFNHAPVGSLTESYVYVFNDAQQGHNLSMMGWSVVPEVNFTRHLGLEGDFTSLYVRSIYPGQGRLLIASGPRFTFAPRSRFTPFIFAEGGEMRLTKQFSP